jgi:hypothetical protein
VNYRTVQDWIAEGRVTAYRAGRNVYVDARTLPVEKIDHPHIAP